MPVVGTVRAIYTIGGHGQSALGLWDRFDALHALEYLDEASISFVTGRRLP